MDGAFDCLGRPGATCIWTCVGVARKQGRAHTADGAADMRGLDLAERAQEATSGARAAAAEVVLEEVRGC